MENIFLSETQQVNDEILKLWKARNYNTTFKGTVLVKNNVVDKNINISRVVLHCSYELLNMFGLTNS